MADLLPTTQASREVELRRKAQVRVAHALATGQTTADIARRLGKGDKRKMANWRQRMRYWMMEDEEFQKLVATMAMAEMRLQIPGVTQALIKRARSGRPDAIKLLFEASGFHNPKLQHEHSGEIKITLTGTPRPEPVVDAEAEVLED